MQLVTGEGTTAQQLSKQGAVILDTHVTPELEAEGIARDLVRLIQQTRKDADLHVSDRIELWLNVPADLQKAIATHSEFIQSETLTLSLSFEDQPAQIYTAEHSLQDQSITIALRKQQSAAA